MKTWLTEFNRRDGTWGVSEQTHANVLAQQQNAWKSLSYVHMIGAYELFNETNVAGGEGNYGFYYIGGNWGAYWVGNAKTPVVNAFKYNR
jgi:hypothetical protein